MNTPRWKPRTFQWILSSSLLPEPVEHTVNQGSKGKLIFDKHIEKKATEYFSSPCSMTRQDEEVEGGGSDKVKIFNT